MKVNKREVLMMGLVRAGYECCTSYRGSHYIKFKMTTTYLWIGLSGALRIGNTIRESVPTSKEFYDAVLRKGGGWRGTTKTKD